MPAEVLMYLLAWVRSITTDEWRYGLRTSRSVPVNDAEHDGKFAEQIVFAPAYGVFTLPLELQKHCPLQGWRIIARKSGQQTYNFLEPVGLVEPKSLPRVTRGYSKFHVPLDVIDNHIENIPLTAGAESAYTLPLLNPSWSHSSNVPVAALNQMRNLTTPPIFL
ncbi:hypothetical protein ACFWXA_31895 [Streptomyces atroolivaceus]|uniref:hypothetical protein n=1 Tax=Streptomyces atroolivaceus TaxID=66869 RepID=UPI0036541CC4